MKNIKDYLHFYLGCEASYTGYGDPPKIVKIFGVSLRDGVQFQFEHNGVQDIDPAIDYFKPILRPLSDYTEEEANEITDYVSTMDGENIFERMSKCMPYKIQITDSFELTKWLLSKQFDLFGLIEAGLAIKKYK